MFAESAFVTNTILLISSEFLPQPGGIGDHAYNLARVFNSHGKKVTVLTNSRGYDQGAEKAFDATLTFEIHRITRYPIVLFTYLFRWIAFFKLLRRNPACFVLASGKFSIWMGAVGKLVFPKNRYLVVLHGTEIYPPGILSKWFIHKSLAVFDQWICVSNFTQTLLKKAVPKARSVVLNNGFDPEKFKPIAAPAMGKNPESPVLISLGNMTRRKGQHQLIQALPYLQNHFPGITYHIVGIPTEKEQLQQLAQKLGVSQRVVFHDAPDNTSVATLLQNADICCQLSENVPNGDVEGFGIAVLEANALGLPAIGSTGCGLEDAIKDGFSGRLVQAQNPEAIREALESVMHNYEAYSANARTWSAEFTWDKRGKVYLDQLFLG